MLSILFKSHVIRHSGTRCAFKNTQRALENLSHSESTRALGQSESTLRVLRALKHLGCWTLSELRHLGTQAIGHLRHLGT